MRACINKGARLNCRDMSGETPFLTAVRRGSLDVAAEMLEMNQVNAFAVTDDDMNALHLMGRLPVVGEAELQFTKALLSRGVDPNGYDCNGDSVVSQICQHSPSATLLKIVLGAGGSAKTVNDKGMTPLHYAVMNKKEEFVRLLLEAGADPMKAPCEAIGSPYEWAAKNNLGTMIATLAAGLQKEQETK